MDNTEIPSALLVQTPGAKDPSRTEQALQSVELLAVADTCDSMGKVPHLLAELEPDFLILDIEILDENTLAVLREIQASNPLPIVVFAARDAPNLVAAIIETGVGAYVVDGVSGSRITAILNLARERFSNWQTMNLQLDHAKQQLSERKLVERAKGILMVEKGLSEPDAYSQMRKTAMDRGVSMAVLAQQILMVFEMLD